MSYSFRLYSEVNSVQDNLLLTNLTSLQLNEFDFDEPTPTVSLTSFRKQKKNPQGGQRKVASFDKIMNDITKVRRLAMESKIDTVIHTN